MNGYDAAFYKVLSRNDTGETGGHQGGVVIPRDIAVYFPHLAAGVGPTADEEIIAELYRGSARVGVVETRFQRQTWGGERNPEHRLTRNLTRLLDGATAGDILKFQRFHDELNRFRVTLVKANTAEHHTILRSNNGARWGPVTPASPPATDRDLQAAIESIEDDAQQPFSPTEPPNTRLTIVQRRFRTVAFVNAVRRAYGRRCAVCQGGLRTPTNHSEVQAAHIIPRGVDGTNDPRNGVALCQSHHWAFDRFLWTLSDDRRVIVPARVRRIELNGPLVEFARHEIRTPREARHRPAVEALSWHRTRALEEWGSA